MKNDLVKDWMAKDPLYIEPRTTLTEAHRLMKEHSIRRLPVLDEGQIVGIVTLGDVREAEPSDASSLSIYEVDYLLSKLMVRDFMTKNPVTVGPGTSLHEAAKIMLERKIGGLPVAENSKLVGIITESDIFRVVVDIFEE